MSSSICYAIIKADLKKNGTPIPENDIWIAATAHAKKLKVATFDEHFEKIAQIEVLPVLGKKE
jgi:tRNA(fMet)-specific endonuclease VapC